MKDAKEPSSSHSNFSNEFQSSQQMDWLRVQDSLKGKLITDDDFKWRLPTREKEGSCEILKYVGGVDLSFSKDDSSIACGTLVVLDLMTHKVVYEDSSIVRLHIPYLPDFLAFREAPVLLELLDKMKNNAHCFYPQLLMVDGNGLLHPRGFGLACHIGVVADLPTVGVGKNLHHVDGLTQSTVRELLQAADSPENVLPLIGDSGCTWGALRVQDSLKGKLITEDDFKWRLPTREKEGSCEILKYVGGVDLSFSKDDSSIACGTLVVLDLMTHKVVYEDSSIVRLHIPYLPGFLAFREAPVLLELLDKMKNNAHCFYPQLLMVDGNGLLHPRGFGLACHIGVVADLPTVGVGKNLHHVDGLTQSTVRELLQAADSPENVLPLIGDSGCTWGAAMRSSEGSLKPIFISVGHRISLATAIEVVRMTCRFRVPEPIRQADIRSRERLRNNQ